MSQNPPIDLDAAHQWFSADCFNRVWEILEKLDRSQDDDERMISLCHASLAHWRDRKECAGQNLSIGYWQLSRVYAVLGQAANAKHYGQLCLDVSAGEPAFFIGYAHEALARAAKEGGHALEFELHLKDARELLDKIDSPENRKQLEADLAELATA